MSIEILNRLNEKEKLLVFKQKTSLEADAIINKFLTKDKSNDLISIIFYNHVFLIFKGPKGF